MNKVISNKIKLIIGAVMIAATIVAGFVTGCSYESNALMSILAGIGLLSFLCALFSQVYRMDVPYIPFMAGNIVGLIVYLYIISKYESIGKTYMILFAVLLFVALFLLEICIIKNEEIGKRILFSIITNVTVHVAVFIAIVAVVTVSVILVGI